MNETDLVKLRMKETVKDLNINRSAMVLDIGSGPGLLQDVLERDIINCDKDKKELMKIKRGNKVIADASNLPFKSDSIDFVFSLEVIEHVKNQEKMLNEMKRVGKRNAIVVITTANKNRLFNRLRRRHVLLDKDHVNEMSLDEFEKIIKKVGLKIIKEDGLLLEFPVPKFYKVLPIFTIKLLFKIGKKIPNHTRWFRVVLGVDL